ncbi:MAG: nitrile hydratase subunit beta [Dehalococcoidia bacterium]|jgi:nitrile hydratase|nr:nitrile hydratase subunit beta [Dehalococcoidia bacterium]MDP6227939.1 nitrile hydratase subunit beta [Dehalococcoidia bacterium]MDP7084292.1 nitrile hydratase subunit beta [Dehalococcoidia bacterium]MDP7201340.1 nitrile hydratase subunit beta [Dehalococcoidia bacterium]MDP7511448.1 nitrile hydratase subunit beta [Dehalococcoidia bacterium]|tara:strand:- start:235 stop:537 length:303 start_codon:yes stop_codon:yes gene_type:complete
MRKVHDLGGLPTDQPIDRTEHEMEAWERRVDSLNSILGEKGFKKTDELRRAIESLGPEQYLTLSYYERFTAAYEALLVERGVMTTEEIDRKMSELERERG